MNPLFQQAMPDVLEYLFELQQHNRNPREARARLQDLRGRHPELEIDLLSEEEAFDHSVHYDTLLRRAGAFLQPSKAVGARARTATIAGHTAS